MQLAEHNSHFHCPCDDIPDKFRVMVVPVTADAMEEIATPEMKEAGFNAKPGQCFASIGNDGRIERIYTGVNKPLEIYDLASARNEAVRLIENERLPSYAFYLSENKLSPEEQTIACIGWYLGCYNFKVLKTGKTNPVPMLIWPSGADRKRTEAFLESHYLLRNVINTPANLMGPEELTQTACEISGRYGAEIFLTREPEIEREFPLVFAVGDSSPRRPVLIDMKWGDPTHPKITIIGKGVCFDTGGLDLKPHGAMTLMKKDMGGAAHALALAILVMKLGLPVHLRVIIPAVENSVSGKAFRLGDVLKTRKGITVENGNTDAEGRLILADCLTLASEDEPDLIIDFATLTGSIKAALGLGMGGFFSNREENLWDIQKISLECTDPMWPMPLWEAYRKDIDGDVADIANVAKTSGDCIHAALFLKEFLVGDPEWIHFDIYAWEQNGKPGRQKGAAETGLRTVFKLLEKRYEHTNGKVQ